MSNYHTSVLLRESIDWLNIKQGEWYVDGTVGGGGHTQAILERGGKVLGIDQDQEALDYVNGNIQNENLRLVRGNFGELRKIVDEQKIEKIAGVLLDFGVSGHQLDTPERGFSFQNGPLDMRMDSRLGVTAKDLVNGLGKDELVRLFERFGEERFAKQIAARIIESRKGQPIETTEALVRIITSVVHHKKGLAHPATKVFQSLRIAVNDELGSIEQVLPQSVEVLEQSGRIVTITFHSLEDRIVKKAFVDFAMQDLGTILTKKPLVPSEEEIERNPRSRSAKLRVFEKSYSED
ncbi:16S rRNA (cytosine(1402)-N(4))-methyltransferase RsmH [soil metagenome]